MSCRDQILGAARAVISSSGQNSFSIGDILTEMHRRRSRYADSTIRTHITSRLCDDAPQHHGVVYGDLRRLGRGRYALAGVPARRGRRQRHGVMAWLRTYQGRLAAWRRKRRGPRKSRGH